MAQPEAIQYLHAAADELREEAPKYLAQVVTSLEAAGLAASSSFLEGNAATIIVAEAEKEPGTLIAISTRGRSGAGRWVLGSVTDKVLRATTTPMLIIRSRGQGNAAPDLKLTSIIVTLDGSPLAEQALPHALALAKAMSLKIILVRTTPSDKTGRGGMEPSTNLDRVLKGAEAEASEYLKTVGTRIREEQGLTVEERVLRGDPSSAVVGVDHEISENLVAMTTHGRSGAARWILGSVTDKVVRQSEDPILVIRAGDNWSGEGS
jgi:nucleotide-binding universal stress UspA family protein